MLTESTLMVENLVIKGEKLSKEAFFPTNLKYKNKCIETLPLGNLTENKRAKTVWLKTINQALFGRQPNF